MNDIGLIDELLDALELLYEAGQPTDTYCDYCDSHAYKEPDPDAPGERVLWIADIVHKPGCIRETVEAVITKARQGSPKE